MSQIRFTKEECENAKQFLEEIVKAIPKSKFLDYCHHFNELFLFLQSAKEYAPSEVE